MKELMYNIAKVLNQRSPALSCLQKSGGLRFGNMYALHGKYFSGCCVMGFCRPYLNVFFDVRCTLAAAKILYVVKLRSLLLRSRPSGYCEIVCVLSDGLASVSPARRLAGLFHA